jgi:hypothetical protein
MGLPAHSSCRPPSVVITWNFGLILYMCRYAFGSLSLRSRQRSFSKEVRQDLTFSCLASELSGSFECGGRRDSLLYSARNIACVIGFANVQLYIVEKNIRRYDGR